MLRNYLMPNGHIYQYEEGKQPSGAELVEPVEEKAEKPKKNKARKPKETK